MGLQLFVVLALPLVVAADVVVLKNGDRVTGKIVQKDGANLKVQTDLMGEVTIAWASVTSVESAEPLTVVLPGGESVQGRIATRDGKVEVEQRSAPLAEVAAIRNAAAQRAYERLLDPGLRDLWAGFFDLGFSFTRGNARTATLTNTFNASRATNTDKTTVYFNQVYARATVDGRTAATARAVRGGWGYNRNASRRLFVNAFNDYEYDRFQNLDLRFVLGGGLGYNVVKNERTRFDLLGGAAYNREKFGTGLVRNSAEAYWGDQLSFRVNSATSLTQSFRMFHNLSNSGEYRINFDLGAVTQLTQWMGFQVSVSDRYLSNPLPGRLKNDILFTTGFRLKFAR
jgi:putative salt-induced outer membrane protein YdiY